VAGEQPRPYAQSGRAVGRTIVLIEPLPVVRQCLREVLENRGYVIISEAETISEALADPPARQPGIVLADVDLGDELSRQLFASLASAFTGSSVIVVSTYDTADFSRIALAGGAAAFVSLRKDLSVLLASIDKVSGQVPTCFIQVDQQEDAPLRRLTRREREVACLIARGMSNKEIASETSLTTVTVRNHVSRIMQKTGAHGRAEVAAKVARVGWV
jgi:DNA-binding NarL/FixJ family response regulator